MGKTATSFSTLLFLEILAWGAVESQSRMESKTEVGLIINQTWAWTVRKGVNDHTVRGYAVYSNDQFSIAVET
jgi:hypothetical protein